MSDTSFLNDADIPSEKQAPILETDDIEYKSFGNGTGDKTMKKLRERNKELEEKVREYLTGWQKERADAVNSKKRLEEQHKAGLKFASEDLLLDLIPTLDNFDSAMKNKDLWRELPKVWTDGMEYIYQGLLSSMEKHGLVRLYPVGKLFDPHRDEAIETVEVENPKDDDKILDVIGAGYEYNGKVIRHARVKVSKLST